MKNFITILLLASLLLLVIFSLITQDAKAVSSEVPDIRFELQIKAGLSTYTTLTDTVSLVHASQLFTKIDVNNDEYILGEYKLAGRNQTVYLAIGSEGWIIAYHPKSVSSQLLLDCTYSFNINEIEGRPERAVKEAAEALGFTASEIGFYDFRYPEAIGIILHWLYIPNSDTVTSNLTLPLNNLYLERGYAFCTAMTNSTFWLNDEIIDHQGGVTQVIYRWDALDSSQLRAGQTNNLRIQALSLFGSGFFSGVSAVYIGDSEITSSGGHTRQIELSYPVMFGEPLNITQNYLPFIMSDSEIH